MRILIVTPLYPPDLGHLAIYGKELAAQLREQHTVTVATYGKLPEAISRVHIIQTAKDLPAAARLVSFTWHLWQAAAKTDLLYVCDGASVGLPAVIVSFLRRLPMVRFVQQDEAYERFIHLSRCNISHQEFCTSTVLSRKIKAIRWLQRFVIAHTKQVLVSTAFLKDIFVTTYKIEPSSLSVVACPPEALKILPFPVEKAPHQLLVLNQQLSPENCQALFTALHALKTSIPDIQVVFANHLATTDSLKNLVRELQLETHVRFLSAVSTAETSYLLQSSKALVLIEPYSQRMETVAYAQQVGLPIIATHDQTSNLAPIEDADKLSQSLKRLFEDPPWCEQLITEGKKTFAEQASWEHHCHKLTDIFEATVHPAPTL